MRRRRYNFGRVVALDNPPASLPASTSRGNTPATAAATNTDNSHETASPPDAAKPGNPGALAPEDPPVGGVSDNTVNPAAAAGSGAHSVAPGPAPGSARIPRLPAPPAAAATEHRACNISPPIPSVTAITPSMDPSVDIPPGIDSTLLLGRGRYCSPRHY